MTSQTSPPEDDVDLEDEADEDLPGTPFEESVAAGAVPLGIGCVLWLSQPAIMFFASVVGGLYVGLIAGAVAGLAFMLPFFWSLIRAFTSDAAADYRMLVGAFAVVSMFSTSVLLTAEVLYWWQSIEAVEEIQSSLQRSRSSWGNLSRMLRDRDTGD